MKIATVHLSNYLAYAQVRGMQQAELKELQDQLPPDLSSGTAQVDVAVFYKVLSLIDQKLQDELWGIKAGHFLSFKLLALIHQLSLRCTTIEEALFYLNDYLKATLPIVKVDTGFTNDQVVIHLRIENDTTVINRIILENTLTIIAREIALMSTDDVSVQIGTPFYSPLYPPHWYKDDGFCLTLHPGILKATLRERSQLHLDMLVPQYVKLMVDLQQQDSFASKVKVTLLSMSEPQLPGIQEIADALFVTPRTLQRRLGQENTTFRALLADLKKQVCLYLLQHECFTIATISMLLGYAEPAAFIHAFKRWFGKSPDRMRLFLKNTS